MAPVTGTETPTGSPTETATGTAAPATPHTRRRTWPGYTAAAAALGYAAPHFWWGAGVAAMFPGDFATAPQGNTEALIGYWVMGAVAVCGAVLSLALVRPWGRRVPAGLIAVPAGIAAIGMTLWGFTYFAMQYLLAAERVVSSPAFAAKDAHPQAAWGLFWYSLFLLWGITLGIAAWQRLRSARR
ncbi:DUF3995 domain-containing protein [Streptomyces sp. NBC_01294]|uniref:DUF3995 domain-containing protein n=2 Tax=unclassified Streptomyces TaxID=2593676 RepID=UPI002DD88E8C|nr:DUF3995 domain-containing protein [Streptomyces sp. NBC_01294]WRZ58762.1 DUF3995 domain-containing protein [Streptomyces sp. NBC_01294]